MGKDLSPEKVGDVDKLPEHQLNEEKLKVYVIGPPEDDRTTTIQDSFIKLADFPEISDVPALAAHKQEVVRFLKRETFGAFPGNPLPLKSRHIYRTKDYAPYGTDIYSFISEEEWRLKVEIHWNQDPTKKSPLMIVLRNPGEGRYDSEAFVNRLDKQWNIAYFEVRGVGEFGWSPELQWHIRRASAWTGRTIASMQVYDVLRCLKLLRTLEGVNPEKTGIAAREDMSVVALYAALLDERVSTLIIKDPPPTQDTPSSPDGRGPAIEMLNCLRVTDIGQLPALIAPTSTFGIGTMPEKWRWSEMTLQSLGKKGLFKEVASMSEIIF